MKNTLAALLAGAALAITVPPASAGDARDKAHDAAEDARDAAHRTAESARDATDRDDSSQPVKDAFLHGKLVSAYAMNPHVSAYDIDVNVDDGVAILTGAVDSDIERDLAVEIARGIDGIRDVRSQLTVKAGSRATAEKDRAGRRSVGQTLDDAGTTAAVKSKLMANHNITASSIDVDTRNGVVTLSGKVRSEAEKDLAGLIARNSADVAEVRNQLSVATR